MNQLQKGNLNKSKICRLFTAGIEIEKRKVKAEIAKAMNGYFFYKQYSKPLLYNFCRLPLSERNYFLNHY